MISIQTNVNSLVAQQNLSVTSAFQSKTIAQLTSGYRINQSGDDAAGLAVANKFRSTVAELTQGVANGNDATAQLQIMDGGMSNISMILDRLKTLATQSSSGTFTGNRSTVNAEFQNDLLEIDRQAQSIGLNTGGTFAKSLDVYLGQGSGSSTLSNGQVTLGLSASAVDSQSLGMKGMQAIAGTADIGNGALAVANLLADGTNTASEATSGSTDFYFNGSGFSDASKVKVSVNLSGVSDTASLVTAFNAAIANAGAGSSQASSSFARAGIVASVHTDSATGAQQLAFTSSTAAFQVQAGDRMANALMGNYSSATTGNALTDSVTGGTTAAGITSFAPAGAGVTIRIQGAGLAAPVDIFLDKSLDTNVTAAIADLKTQLAANASLKAAGISLSGSAAAPLVFTSARGESFNVMATGDTKNLLGLGSFVTNSTEGTQSNQVDYRFIAGSAVTPVSATNDQATMQFSINGAAATNVAVDLTLGNAVASKVTTSIIANPEIIAGTNAAVNFKVDGIAVSGNLSGSSVASVTGAGAPTYGAITAVSSGAAIATAAPTVLIVNNALSFSLAVDGGPTQVFTLAAATYTNGNNTVGGSYAKTLNDALTAASAGATIDEVGGFLRVTSNKTGTASSVNLTDGAASAAKAVGTATATFTATDFVTANVGANTFTVNVGAGAVTVTMSRVDSSAQDLVNDINYNAGVAHASFSAVLSGVANDKVSIVSTATGNAQTIVVTSALLNTATDLKITSGSTHTGDDTLLTNLKLNTHTGLQSGVAGNNQFTISSDSHTAATTITITPSAGLTTGVLLANAINARLQAAGLNDYAAGAENGGFGTTTVGIVAAINGSNELTLSSSTVGSASWVRLDAPPAVNATVSSALTPLNIVAGFGTGTSATAAGLATQLQGFIDTATGVGTPTAGDVHATVSVNADNSITITNDNKGSGHTLTALAGTAATGAVPGTDFPLATSFLGTNAAVVGTNRTGADMAAYLNGVFSSDSTLQPAQLTATWNHAGQAANTLTVESGNNTNFRVNSGTAAQATMTGALDIAGGIDFSGGGNQVFQASVDGGTTWKTITLNTDTTGAGAVGAQNLVDALNTALAAAPIAVTASLVDAGGGVYHVKLSSDTIGTASQLQVQGAAGGPTGALAAGKILDGVGTNRQTADADLGFGLSGASFTTAGIAASGTAVSANLTTAGPLNYMVDAGGASSANTTVSSVTNAIAFSALQFGNDTQAITISGNDQGGNAQSKTITLTNLATSTSTDRAGRNIDQAISYINTQLQTSNNATLQKITAVKEKGSGGLDQINFISSLSTFNVSVGSTANADGVDLGVSKNYAVGTVGAGANMSVDTKANALQAVTAIAGAIAQLGSAQAAVGKGQNQLAYAVSLAQSQITNFSAAESQIRDANVAQQAANLSKAQVLSQASIAAMAQANSAPQAVLSLLRG